MCVPAFRVLAAGLLCILSVVATATTPAPAAPVQEITPEWKAQYGLTGAGSGNLDDPDNDGRTNLQEFSDNTHPRGFFTRYLAEGATGTFFDAAFALVNPTDQPARVLMRFLKSDGTVPQSFLVIPPLSRRTIVAKDIAGLAQAEFSTVIESDGIVVVDRTMTWDTRGYGSHAETSLPSPSPIWYLAEGATQSGFNLFYLLQNPSLTEPAQVRVRYLRPGGVPPIEKTYSVGPSSRFNIWVDEEQFPTAGGSSKLLASTDVSAVIEVTNNVPIIVERAMYLDRPGQVFGAGHESTGITAPGTRWFLAEGATGSFFDLFILIANPGAAAADVRATFLLPDGTTFTKTYVIDGNSRFNIWVDEEGFPGAGKALADVAVSTTIESLNNVPIIVERAMWWPGPTATTWAEAHNSGGATSTGTRWALAEGEVGGARSVETYILIANTSSFAGTAKVTLLFEDGSASPNLAVNLPASSRTNVAVASAFPAAAGKRFGAIIESIGSTPAQMVVERAMYSNAEGAVWAAGTNALATRLEGPGQPSTPPSITSFTATPSAIPPGTQSTLAWTVVNATRVGITPGFAPGLATSSAVKVGPTATTVYLLTAVGPGGVATATMTVSIDPTAPVPGRPAAVDDVATTTDEVAIEIAVLANDSDPDGDPMTVTGVSAPTKGLAVLIAGNRVRYTPTLGQTGDASFTYTVSDGKGGVSTAKVVVSVTTPGLTVIESSPGDSEGSVAVTRETILRFSRAIVNPGSVTDAIFFAEFAGTRLPTRVHMSLDAKTATLFYLQTLPASARVRVRLVTDSLVDDRGRGIDGDGDGKPGGTAIIDFDTLTLTTVPGTIVTGHVFASELGVGASNVPLAAVLITVDGLETTLRTTTDANGLFQLTPAPAGDFFVHIDGRTATNPIPVSAYYPTVGKKWTAAPGKTTDIGNVFLPLVVADTLKPVSQSSATVVQFPPSVTSAHPELVGVSVTIPADSLFSDSGARGGMVGIAPVDPNRLPSPLPLGVNPAVVITIQTDGASNFDRPAPACFPNLPNSAGNKLAGGSKSSFWSFNHDTGDWEIVGISTVTADGALVCTDPGVGIRQPGWHFMPPPPPPDPEPPPPPPETYDGDGDGSDGGPPPPPGSGDARATACPVPQWADVVAKCGEALASSARYFAAGGPALTPVRQYAPRLRNGLDSASAAYGLSLNGVQPGATFWSARAQEILEGVSETILTNPGASTIVWSAPAVTATGIDFGLDLSSFRLKSRLLRNHAAAAGVLSAALDWYDCVAAGGPCLQSRLEPAPFAPWIRDVVAAQSLAVTFAKDALGAAIAQRLPVDGRPKVMVAADGGRLRAFFTDGAPVIDRTTSQPFDVAIASLVDSRVGTDAVLAKAFLEKLLAAYQAMDTALDATRPIVQTGLAQLDSSFRTLSDARRAGGLTPPSRPMFYRASDESLVLQRGRSSSLGRVSVRVRAQRLIKVEVVNPVTRAYGFSFVFASQPTVRLPLPDLIAVVGGHDGTSSGAADGDGDGLNGSIEAVIGTRNDRSDTDGDGVSDSAEIDAGTDPLSGVTSALGVVRSVDTPGKAVDVATRNDLAVVADSGAGVAIVNVAPGVNPLIIAQVDTSGDARAVAFEGTRVAVADGPGGFAIVDISDPPASRIVHQISSAVLGGDTKSVTVAGPVAYVGLESGDIVTIDLTTGGELDRVSLGLGVAVHDLFVERDTLYAVTIGKLHAILTLPLQVAASIDSPGGVGAGAVRRWRVFAGGGIAYVTHNFGYNTHSLAVPGNPELIAPDTAPQFGWKHVVANGTGLGFVAVGNNSTDDGPHDVSLYDLSDSTKTYQPIAGAEFVTPGLANAVSLYNGVGYVADSLAGLQVVEYLAADTGTIKPTIALSSNFPVGATTGTADEGQLMRLTAAVGDDVQVRNVDFFIDGVRVAIDGNFPFEHRFITPTLAQQPSVLVRACAVDTAGNSTCTSDITITLRIDSTAPRIVQTSPRSAGRIPEGNNLRVVTARFSEPMRATGLTTATFRLFRVGTPDVLVPGGTVTYGEESTTGVLSFAAALTAGRYRAVVSGSVADLTGNTLGADFAWTFEVTGPATWICGGPDLRWGNAANWSSGFVPQEGDKVVIDCGAANPTITIDANTAVVAELRSEELIVINGNGPILSSSGRVDLNAGLEVRGGGTIDGTGDVTLKGSSTWVFGIFQGTGALTVASGATLTMELSQHRLRRSLTNQGTVVLKNSLLVEAGGSITNATGASWELQAQGISAVQVLGNANQPFVNQGLLRKTGGTGAGQLIALALSNTGTINLETGSFNTSAASTNTGTMAATAGTTLDLANFTLQPGTSVTGGTLLVSTGILTLNTPPMTFPQAMTITGGAIINGPGDLTLGGAVTWIFGTFDGTGALTVASGATLTMELSQHRLRRALTNQGTVVLKNELLVEAGGSITNAAGATWELQAQLASAVVITGTAATQPFVNAGVLRKAGGTGAGQINAMALTNTGAIDLQTGSFNNSVTSTNTGASINTGTMTAAAGTTLDLANFTLQPGTVVTGGTLLVSGGILTLNTPTPMTFPQPMTITGGALINGPGALTLGGAVTWVYGTFDGTGALTLAPGATLNIETSQHRLRRALTNNGTVVVKNELLVEAGGSIRNAASGAFEINPATNAVEGAVVLTGNANQVFLNEGLLRFAGNIGHLTMNSLAFSTTGTIRVRLGGTAATMYDHITSSATLGGTLDVQTLNFTPSAGNTFDVLVGARSGTFATVNLNGHVDTVTYLANAVRLTKQ